MTEPRFRLFPEPTHFWSFNDHAAVLRVMHRLRPSSVLEFGPGSSTLALIEGGAARVDCLEDHPEWANVYADRLQRRFPAIVSLYWYTWHDPLSIHAIDSREYDLALIDGPFGTPSRPAVLRYALPRCRAVLMPTEDASGPGILRPIIADEAAKAGRSVEFMETGPLSGGFALIQ